jgi:hypothetical protein
VYFLPAVGWEKVIEIRRFSNETAIVEIPSSPPPTAGGKILSINLDHYPDLRGRRKKTF